MMNYEDWRIIDGKSAQRVVVDETGKMVNRNPSKSGRYEKYGVRDKDELKKANETWKKIIANHSTCEIR